MATTRHDSTVGTAISFLQDERNGCEDVALPTVCLSTMVSAPMCLANFLNRSAPAFHLATKY